MSGRCTGRNAVAIRQIGFQDLGVIHAPLVSAGYEVRYLDAFAADLRAIDPIAPDLVVVLGGPYGVDEGASHPFIDAEVALLQARLGARRPTFGICLGAQLMARALGARVGPGECKEIGWKPVALNDAGARGPLAELTDLPVLHWHDDTFDLPDDAVLLASSDVCSHQAFGLGREILGTQFHLEVDPRLGMEAWIACHEAELRSEGIEPRRLVAAAQAAASTDRTRVPAMFARWLSQLA